MKTKPSDTENDAVGTLAQRIHRARLERRESLQDLADAVGVSKAHIWELEKGRADNPSMGLVTRLADHFDLSIGYLVGEDIEAPDADVHLARMFRQARDLTPGDREMLDAMLRAFLERHVRGG